MNNKGFTLIEVVLVIVLVTLVLGVVINMMSGTLAASENTTYKLFKNNIVSAGYNYVDECSNKIIDCDFDFDNNNIFKAEILKYYGYFTNLNSPIDDKYLGDCLVLKAIRDNGVVVIEMEDNCY